MMHFNIRWWYKCTISLTQNILAVKYIYQLLSLSLYIHIPLALETQSSLWWRRKKEVFLWVKVFPPPWWEVEVMRFTFSSLSRTKRGVTGWVKWGIMATTAKWTNTEKDSHLYKPKVKLIIEEWGHQYMNRKFNYSLVLHSQTSAQIHSAVSAQEKSGSTNSYSGTGDKCSSLFVFCSANHNYLLRMKWHCPMLSGSTYLFCMWGGEPWH